MPSFSDRLHRAIIEKNTPALVGLDPRYELLPKPCIDAAGMRRAPDVHSLKAAAFEAFCFEIIEIVAPLVPAVKPQAAFFEEHGPAGTRVLQRVVRRARDKGLIVILDAKRGDIGSTAGAYARGYLAGEDPDAAPWAADALTVNPYLGPDTLAPFVETAHERNAGLYILVRTSNPGAAEFQSEPSQGTPLYRTVGKTVEQLSCRELDSFGYGAVGAVVGATCPEELKEMREQMPHVPLLVPGYGSQGGTSADAANAFDLKGLGAVVNSSRGINFAFRNEKYREQFTEKNWQQAVEQATKDMIVDLANHTPASLLKA